MQSNTCVPKFELKQFIQGSLSETQLNAIAEHVDACEPCQDTVVAIAEQSDTFVQAVKAAGGQAKPSQENALQLALKRMRSSVRHAVDVQHEVPPAVATSQLGPYRMQERLGVGGMGHVYRAVHTKLKRTVALKVLPAQRWANSAAITRFEREMEAIGCLEHPHIVRASDAGEDQGMHFLVMEYIDGLDLSRLVNRLGPLPVAEVCEIGRQTALGLAYAHDNGLVHRDIKPSNLMLARNANSQSGSSDAQIKLLDLGLALLGDEHLQDGHELTTVGTLMGTLDYMSPEQGVDSHAVDQRTDIYGLGATLFKLLTGRAPYADPTNSTLMKKMTALATKAAPSIGSVRPDLPADLVDVIDRMLARDPDDRFESADQVATSLSPFAVNAKLDDVLARGMLTEDPELGSSNATPIEPLESSVPQLAKADAAAVRSRSRAGVIVALATLAAVAAGGILFHMSTNFGDLTISSDDPNATVLVKRADGATNEIQIKNGKKTVSLRVGEYALTVTGDAKISVRPETVAIKRGATVDAEVITDPDVKVDAKPGSMDERIAASEKEMQAHFDAARAFMEEGNAQLAIAEYDKVLAMERNAKALAGKADAFASLGWADQAVKAYRSALEIGFSEPRQKMDTQQALADMYMALEQYSEALNLYGYILQLPGASLDADVWYKSGLAEYRGAMQEQYITETNRLGRLKKSLDRFRRALQLEAHPKAKVEKEKLEALLATALEGEKAVEAERLRLQEDESRLAELAKEIPALQKAYGQNLDRLRAADLGLRQNSKSSSEWNGHEARRLKNLAEQERLVEQASPYFELLEAIRPRRSTGAYMYLDGRIWLTVELLTRDLPPRHLYRTDDEGRLNLGVRYGRVNLTGLTIEEAEHLIWWRLRDKLLVPAASVTRFSDEEVGTLRANGGTAVASSTAKPQDVAEVAQTAATIQPGDLLRIHVPNAIPDDPIDGLYPVESSGAVHLGASYGRVQIAGLDFEHAEAEVEGHLKEFLKEPSAMLTKGLPPGISQSPSEVEDAGLPVYKDHNYRYWRERLRTQRDHETIADAIAALGLLGSDNSREAAEAIVQAMRHTAGARSDVLVVAMALAALDQPIVVDVLVEEMQNGNNRSRYFIDRLLRELHEERRSADLLGLEDAIKVRAKDLVIARLSHMPSAEQPQEHARALAFLWHAVKYLSVSVSEVPELGTQLQASYAEGSVKDDWRQNFLLKHYPNTPGLLLEMLPKGLVDQEFARVVQIAPPTVVVGTLEQVIARIDLAVNQSDPTRLLFLQPVFEKLVECGPAAKDALPSLRGAARLLYHDANKQSVFAPLYEAIRTAVAAISECSEEEAEREVVRDAYSYLQKEVKKYGRSNEPFFREQIRKLEAAHAWLKDE